jgi:hypothetical protein
VTTDTRGVEKAAGIRRFIPILSWLPRYDRSGLSVDVIAGLTLWGLVEAIGADRVFATVDSAVRAIEPTAASNHS